MEQKVIKIKMNPTREKVLEVLKKAEKPLTLAEISERAGIEVKSGSTNALITAGLIKIDGEVKVPVVRYEPRKIYTLGNIEALKTEKEAK